jgi:transcriptional regulator with XRE-family HTH domain
MSLSNVVPIIRPQSLAVTVGTRIRKVRKARGLTLKDVSQGMGTTMQTLQRLEVGTMTLSVEWIEKIANALDVDPVSFFTDRTTTDEETQAIFESTIAKCFARWLSDQSVLMGERK